MNLFQSYSEWHAAITGPCGLTLSKEYCTGRIAALQDPAVSSTRAFIDQYGDAYCQQVIGWFQQALQQAD